MANKVKLRIAEFGSELIRLFPSIDAATPTKEE